MPPQPGEYQICVDGEKIWEGKLWKAGKSECNKAYACTLTISEPQTIVEKNKKGSTVGIKAYLTNIGGPQNYDLFIYSKVNPEENEETAQGTVPPYVKLNPSDKVTGTLDTGETFEIEILFDVPDKPYKFSSKACEKGNKRQCEYVSEELTNYLPYYSNLVLKAKGKTEDVWCEVPFDLDLTKTCVEEICDNNEDDDCDDLIDEGVIAVYVTDHTKETITDPETGEEITLHGTPTPLNNTKVYFFRYTPTGTGTTCVDELGLSNPTSWQNYQTIVDNCKENQDTYYCITDSNGYCEVEVPIYNKEGEHFLAIAVDENDIVTTKHFGVPVGMVKCGKTKKTWHLSSHPS